MAFKLERNKTTGAKFAPGSLHLGGSPYELEPESRTPLRVAVIATIAFHALLFVISFPTMRPRALQAAQAPKAFVVQAVRFKPPPPAKAEPIPQRKTKKIPIPDPTPDEPEPLIREQLFEAPQLEIDGIADVLFDLPEAPSPAGPPGTLFVEGDVLPPKKTYAPLPNYTEEARQARVQGVVILQAVVDTLGHVGYVKVLKGLPEGLTESAVQVVQEWRYEPATLNGEPVPVYINLTVNFSLQ